MSTAIIYDEAFLRHATPEGHPESPERLKAIIQFLKDHSLLDHRNVQMIKPRMAEEKHILAVHTPEHLQDIQDAEKKAQTQGIIALDEDTFVSKESYQTAMLAAGAGLTAIDTVLSGAAQNAFVLARPPGHHAEEDFAMGFCLFNNIAVAAKYAQQEHHVPKILIVDFDVHHGNGTQEIFYQDPSVAYFSIHQAPYYPGTGAYDEIGAENAEYTTCNAPIPAESLFELYDAIFREILFPFADRFRPDLLLVSAGYDAHWKDPLAKELLDTSSYAALTAYLKELAETYCQGKMVLFLEGGYDLAALSESVAASLCIMIEESVIIDTLGPPQSPGYRWNFDAVTDQLRAIQNLTGFRRKVRIPGPAPDDM